jgi:sirohydrochlorin cobaltochelatase
LPKLKKISAHLLVCKHKTCAKQGAKESARELKRALKETDLRDKVLVTKVDCLDQCGHGPVVVVYPDGVWYGGVDAQGAREIIVQHVAGGRVATRCKVMRDMRDASKLRE